MTQPHTHVPLDMSRTSMKLEGRGFDSKHRYGLLLFGDPSEGHPNAEIRVCEICHCLYFVDLMPPGKPKLTTSDGVVKAGYDDIGETM